MEEQERQFKGIWIPSEIWLTEELSLQEKVVLVEIDSLEDKEKGCYASNKYFANFFKLSPGRISQIITNLIDKDYIEVKYIKKGKEIKERQIRIKRPPYPLVRKLNTYLENDDRGIKKTKEGYLENAKENNTTTNNIKNNNKEVNKNTPTLEEIKDYCLNVRHNKVDYKKFYDYFTEGNWIDSKGNKVKNWKQKIITWEKNTTDKKEFEYEQL
jgi:hypothetical protein